MTIRVGVFGAAGRMGRTVCDAVAGDAALELVAAIDPQHDGLDLRPVAGVDVDLRILGSTEGMAATGAQVAVDFTAADAARENARWCAANGVHAVIGTSGLTDDDIADLRERFTTSNCLIAPNFAIGAVLLIRLSELAAPYFDTVEILEQHHDGKIDAPSGTAIHTAERLAAVKGTWAADPTQKETLHHPRGAVAAGGIHVHSMRLRGIIASQEVMFGTTGQTLSIRHDTYDRSSFMPGVLLAVKRIADHPGVTVGLDRYLGI
jgi:4-hydroxy-tetrahydrodipicolinate reductase